jgi:CUB/sushi domain-containing protein
MDSDTDTFTCQQDGHWVPERITCSPKKCPVPSNMTRIRFHGDDFQVNRQVSVSCAEGFTHEGVNWSTCQVRYCVRPETCKPNSGICYYDQNSHLALLERTNSSSFHLHPKIRDVS